MTDPYRPGYHFTAPAGWLNDPNGLIQWQGRYHMFYQYNPHEARWGYIHWGHAISDDLLHWRDLPIALFPEPGMPREDGCWSGVAVNDGGVPTFVYTEVSGGKQLPYVAVGSADLLTWRKHPNNPVIAAPPAGVEVPGFRDHSLWREGEYWYQVIGSGIAGQGGACFLYRGRSLLEWEYLGILCGGSVYEGDEMWECPDFFALGDRHVLVVSPIPLGRAVYLAGTYAAQQFTADARGDIDGGRDFYAPQSFVDERGRRIMFGWVREARSEAAQLAAGWSGAMSLPRLITARADGRVGMAPAPEVAALRGERYARAALSLPPAAYLFLDDLHGDMLEIAVTLDPGTAARVGVAARASADRSEETLIVYDRDAGCLTIDRSRADGLASDSPSLPLPLASGEMLELRIFVDRSIIEVFANGYACLTARVYPERADSTGVAVFAEGGAARMLGLEAWRMPDVMQRTKPE